MGKAIIGSMSSIDCALETTEYRGSVIICWSGGNTPERKKPQQVLPGVLTQVLDYETEKLIPVAHAIVHVPCGGIITADLAVYLDNHGEIIYDLDEVGKSGTVPATFPFLVGEMRTSC
jgi:hypothetical protein